MLNSLHKCKRAACLYLGAFAENIFFEECVRALQRELAIDLYLSETILLQIEGNPFVLNRLLDVRSHGANIYISDKFDYLTDLKFICQADFKDTVVITKNNTCEKTDALPYESLFSSADSETYEYQNSQNDIQVLFNAASKTVIKGKSTSIHWEIKNADHVKIDGFGDVSDQGKREVQILDNTILVLQASNKKQRKFKAINLRAVESLQIDYDVQFFNPASKQFVSLKDDKNYEGVFGVSKGHKIKLVWNAEHADKIEIIPFDLSKKAGEYIFLPDGTTEINIKATLQDRVSNRRIIIHEFPMPVFTGKFVGIKEDFTSKIQLNVIDMRKQAYDFIDKKGMFDQHKVAEKLLTQMKSREKRLVDAYNRIGFGQFYEDHSVERLNKSIIGRLKSYFNDKEEVQKMINLLHQYNE